MGSDSGSIPVDFVYQVNLNEVKQVQEALDLLISLNSCMKNKHIKISEYDTFWLSLVD
jgi:hypothetical protein